MIFSGPINLVQQSKGVKAKGLLTNVKSGLTAKMGQTPKVYKA